MLIQRLRIPPDVNNDYFLYTDSDVLFLRDVNSCSFPAKPRAFLMGPEHIRSNLFSVGFQNSSCGTDQRVQPRKFQ